MYFTRRRKRGSVSLLNSQNRFSVTIDDRGRIFIPAEIRRSFGMTAGETLFLYPITSENAVLIKRGVGNAK
ncbi:MAG: AbrB/MazE/SpoVT family DNA-binding domain-containing protein [Candidatus Aenigmarchaeota archaeon]|nr:AbrB/MazE/SpoVT family DNA-binding domain-containing protein [Candidatus Aenigmarchaeota archaeon]